MRLLPALLIGCLLGVLGARFLFVGSWLSLMPWSIGGIAIGLFSREGEWALAGGLYGFTLLLVFMIAGYSGAAPAVSRLPFFGIIGLAGACYGMVLSLIAVLLRRRFGPARSRNTT